MTTAGFAHETRLAGPADGEQYALVVGMLNEPVFTDLRTGLDLTVLRAADDSPVEGLERALEVTLTAPSGEARTLELRAVHGQAGHYADDYVLTMSGSYEIRVHGFIGSLEIDETFSREVGDGADLRFP